MDNQSPEMEKMSHQLRDLMAAWIANPDNEGLKAQYKAVHAQYQEMRTAWIRSQEEAAAS